MLPLFKCLRTASYLRPRQLVHQLLRRLGPRPRLPSVPAEVALRPGVGMSPTLGRCAGGEGRFEFLNVARPFDGYPVDWRAPEMSRLWRYNLHYFDWLQDAGRPAAEKARLVNDWLAEVPPGAADAWDPFPVSLRLVNWIKFFLSAEGAQLIQASWLQSLWQQARWLERNIEYHLLANHYFKNGKALLFAGLYFDGPDADRWLRKGRRILSAELEEQVLSDGGHFERSPMYHAMILEDCLDLLNMLLGAGEVGLEGLCDRLREKSRSMLRFLLGMSHPDGDIALFNDAAFGIEARPAELAAYYKRITGCDPSAPAGDHWAFPDTGYFVMAPEPGDRLIVDCGPVGPNYQPGHSHCDTLSFELSLKGRRVIVDSGCCQYLDGEIRRYNRGNMGHNTLTIDGKNQSEVWGAHRCARRATSLYASLEKRPDGGLHFSGAHNGYCYLPGKPVHHRTISWSAGTCLIGDRVDGQGTHDIETRLHIHPGLMIEFAGEKATIRHGADIMATVSLPGTGRIDRCEGWYCPEFGRKAPCTVLKAGYENVPLPFSGGWIISTGG